MKMEERDRLIQDEGIKKGLKLSLVSAVRKQKDEQIKADTIADLFGVNIEEVSEIATLAEANPDWTDLQIAEELVRQR